jgi:DNA-binding winged helix-turn-helix (wHTH) protein
LYLLIANAGRLLTRGEILSAVWGPDYLAQSNVVDQYVHTLRSKLQNHWKQPRFIATVPGEGYGFVVTETAEPRPESVLMSPRPEPVVRLTRSDQLSNHRRLVSESDRRVDR